MLALVAVVLAFGGVHAVLSQMVAEERRELVIRLALGAPRGQLMWRVTREAIAAVLAGAVIGVSAGLAGARAIRSLLFGVKPLDVEVIAGGIALLLVLAVLAAASPARRIGLMDPAAALRGD
jgi:ABC-type antimicrobial peptide transport system permease subunit